MKNKKGVELTMSTIVIAALVLIVLIVMVLIFTGKIGKTGEEIEKVGETVSLEKCSIPGYRKCVPAGTCEIEQTEFRESCPAGEYCCLISDIIK